MPMYQGPFHVDPQPRVPVRAEVRGAHWRQQAPGLGGLGDCPQPVRLRVRRTGAAGASASPVRAGGAGLPGRGEPAGGARPGGDRDAAGHGSRADRPARRARHAGGGGDHGRFRRARRARQTPAAGGARGRPAPPHAGRGPQYRRCAGARAVAERELRSPAPPYRGPRLRDPVRGRGEPASSTGRLPGASASRTWWRWAPWRMSTSATCSTISPTTGTPPPSCCTWKASPTTRKFMSAARAAARTKPVIVVQSGPLQPESVKAAATHTGALAGADASTMPRSAAPVCCAWDAGRAVLRRRTLSSAEAAARQPPARSSPTAAAWACWPPTN